MVMFLLCRVFVALLCIAKGFADGTGFCHFNGRMEPDAPQHTGYLSAGSNNASYFYYLATSRSATPESDPLIIWLTGGPGCSSVFALLTENGPCSVSGREDNGRWLLEPNQYSWSEAGNVVWIDQPMGVGYSPDNSATVATESEVAERMFDFLQAFYVKFPVYLKVPLFITGESYGGHYVPAVASRVLRGQGDGVGILQGIAIGNAEVDPSAQWASKPLMALTGGPGGTTKGVVNVSTFISMEENLQTCEHAIKKCADNPKEEQCMVGMSKCIMGNIMPIIATGRNPYDLRIPCHPGQNLSQPAPQDQSQAVGLDCYNVSTVTEFLNDPVTKERLGVPQDMPWKQCNLAVTVPFITSGDQMESFRGQVIHLLDAGVQVVVYAGDTDFMVDWIGCRDWVRKLPWEHQTEWAIAPERPYIIGNQSYGMKQTSHGLSFIQIYGAGHMVPMDQPLAALTMLKDLVSHPSTRTPSSLRLAVEQRNATGAALGMAVVFGVAMSAFVLKRLKFRREEQNYYLMV